MDFIVMLTILTSWREICRVYVDYLFYADCDTLREMMIGDGNLLAILLIVERRSFFAAQYMILLFISYVSIDAFQGFVLVWLQDRNVPWFRSLFVFLSGCFSMCGRLFQTFLGFGPIPQNLAAYEPPHWVQTCLYIGYVLLALVGRSLAK